jgi:hypothetical protein
MLKVPLFVVLPYPVAREIDPPVTEVDSPDVTATRPPAEILPDPTITLTLPDVPFDAFPLRNVMRPLLALLVVPEMKERDAEVPAVPEIALRMLNAPLELARP